MAVIELGALGNRLSDDLIADLEKALEKAGAKLPQTDAALQVTISDTIDDDVFAEFLDRLDDEGIACDIYLPVDFDDRVEVGDFRVGAASQLLEALEELRDELAVDEDEDDADEDEEEEEDDDEDDADFTARKNYEQQMKRLWHHLYDAAEHAIAKRAPLWVRPG